MKNSPITTLRSLLLGLALLAAGNTHAVVMGSTLDTLINGGSITAGDKVFDQWTVIQNDSSDLNPIDLNQILVTPLSDGGMDPGPGLSFDILGGALDVTGGPVNDPFGFGFAYKDLMFGFRVSTLGNLKIKDSSLTLGPTTLSALNQDLGVYMDEYLGTTPTTSPPPFPQLPAHDLGIMTVENSWVSAALSPTGTDVLTSNLSDAANFLPQDQVFVTKNIYAWATDPNETVSPTGFTQRFSQVPEPGTMFLLAPAAVGLLVMRRKSKAPTV